mgnify:CR=1 FL=1
MSKGKLIHIPVGRRAVYYTELVGHNVEKRFDEPDVYKSPITNERFITLLKRTDYQKISIEFNENIPKTWITENFKTEAQAKINQILEAGFNVYTNGIDYEEKTVNYYIHMKWEYYVDESEIYQIIFSGGVTDDAINEAVNTGKYFVDKKIDELYEKALAKFNRRWQTYSSR